MTVDMHAAPAPRVGRMRAWWPISIPRRVPRPLVLILAVAMLLSLAWNLALPAFQGPDEDAHFAYVQHLAETGQLPTASGGESPVSTQEHDALDYLNLFPLRGVTGARPGWSTADLALLHQLEKTMPAGGRADGSGPNAVGQDPPLYYAVMSIPYLVFAGLPLLKLIFVLRLFNALCYLATIALTWTIAGDLFGRERWKQTLAAGAVALVPQLAFMSAVINADNLLIALTTAFLLSALRVLMRGPTVGRVLVMSVLCAAACLTHGRGLVTLPVLAVALVAGWVRFRAGGLAVARQLGASAGTLGVAALLYFLFGTPGGTAYGGQVTQLNGGGAFSVRGFLEYLWRFYLPALPGMKARLGPAFGFRQVFIETFYGAFGWLEVRFKPRIYDVLELASVLGVLWLTATCLVRRRLLRSQWPQVLVMLALLVVTVVFLHYVSYRTLVGDHGSDPLIVGRYLLPIISLFGLAIAFTIGSLPRRLGSLAGAGVLAAGVLLSLTGLGITAVRFYG
jgi:hypothetical protein